METLQSFFQNYGVHRNSVGMQQNALLQTDEWKEIDAAVLRVARAPLPVFQDLLDAGLVQRLGGLGTLASVVEQLSDMSSANVSMDAETPGEEDLPAYSPLTFPVPIFHKDFRINIRTLEASRRLGDALDTSAVETATRKVNEAIEVAILNGTGLPKVGANQAQGYTNKTGRSSGTAASYGGGDFGTAYNPFKTVNGMVNALLALGFVGPFATYIAPTQYTQATALLTDGSGLTEIQAMLKNIPNLKSVKMQSSLTDANVVVVSLQKDVVDLAIALDITPVQWDEKGGMVQRFKVMTALTPRVKHDANSAVGIAHATAA